LAARALINGSRESGHWSASDRRADLLDTRFATGNAGVDERCDAGVNNFANIDTCRPPGEIQIGKSKYVIAPNHDIDHLLAASVARLFDKPLQAATREGHELAIAELKAKEAKACKAVDPP
jgi:hypothetical protein